ncbi:hypothetical protein J2Z22_001987 [Paenibacillus forsythiae]|uniref:ABC transporter permease n=1 Tax=Paenibacillus forsythiae TaxID=365616 RepID=A0ABU3H6L5_9BACL|nr:hypothetical protein [Paenibacillus forsythiae]MDT3426461.1 hypothetical protein [Paenibacillus forsythiae]
MLQLIAHGMRNHVKVKYLLTLFVIMMIAIGVPFFTIFKTVGKMISDPASPMDLKQSLTQYIENLFLVRISISIFLISAWSFFPKLFWNNKMSGEVEAMLAIGYSARKLWFSKALTSTLLSIMVAYPIIIVFDITLRLYLHYHYSLSLAIDLLPWAFSLLFNPIFILLIILYVGGYQLLTNDVKKSSFSVIILAIINMSGTFGSQMEKIAYPSRPFLIVYGVCFVALFLLIFRLFTFMTTENVIYSKLERRKQTQQTSNLTEANHYDG